MVPAADVLSRRIRNPTAGALHFDGTGARSCLFRGMRPTPRSSRRSDAWTPSAHATSLLVSGPACESGTTIVLEHDDPASGLRAGDRGVVREITPDGVVVEWERGFSLVIDPQAMPYRRARSGLSDGSWLGLVDRPVAAASSAGSSPTPAPGRIGSSPVFGCSAGSAATSSSATSCLVAEARTGEHAIDLRLAGFGFGCDFDDFDA